MWPVALLIIQCGKNVSGPAGKTFEDPCNSVGAGRVRAKKGSQLLDLKQLWRMHRLMIIMCGMFLMAKAQVSDFNGRRSERRFSSESE